MKKPFHISSTETLKSTFLLLVFLMIARLGWAETRYVDSSATLGSNNGLSWVNAFQFLSDALADAQSDPTIDTILVAKGTYYPTGLQSGVKRDSVFAILRNNLKIFGGFQPGGTGGWTARELPTSGSSGSILSGDIGIPNDSSDNSYHVVAIFAPFSGQIDTSEVILDGFTVTGGNGINNSSGNMTLNGQQFNNQDGAGIYIGTNTTGAVTSPTISHCVITQNQANYGGGIYQANYGGLLSAVVDACVISDNVANSNGAGVFIQALTASGAVGQPVIKHTVIENNQAGASGGGLSFNDSIGQLTLRQVSFRNNIAPRGGGVYHQSGKITADSCNFYSNVATNGGGGGWCNLSDSAILSSVWFIGNIGKNQNCNGGAFRNEGGNVVIADAVFKSNHADSSYAGAWYNEDATVFMTNTLFSGNRAKFGGAWFSEEDSTQIITNTTFSGNLATGDNTSGGAIRTSNKESHLNIRLRNSILWGNSTEIDGTVILSNTIVSGGASGGIDINPLFVLPVSFSTAPDTSGDYHLSSCSPAINVGDNSSIPAGLLTDLDGNARIFNTTVDLGAYELQKTVPQYTAIYVDSANGNDGNDGASWATAFKTLSYALDIAHDTTKACYANVDSILVARGTYYPTGVQGGTNRDSSFSIFRGGLKIYGGFPSGGGTFSQRVLPSIGGSGGGTILSGNIGAIGDSVDNSRHIVIIVGIDAGSDSLIIDGFRIQDGVATGAGSTYPKGEPLTNSKGAGVYTSRIDTTAAVIINHCLIVNNHAASHGGGVVANNSFFYLLNSTVAHNRSGDLGGGLYDAGGSKLMIRKCDFLANQAMNGGGIYNNTGSSPIIEDCSILLNTADSATGNGGGGIYNADNSYPLVIRCVIAGNSGNTGGGWYNAATANAKLYNVLFSGNWAKNQGAAWYSAANDSVWLVNTTIAGNHVNFMGGGSVFLAGNFNNVILQNSIIWNNNSTLVGDLTLTNSIVKNSANGGWDWDPQFVAPADNFLSPDTLGNYRLSACSPALNAGDSAALPSWLTVGLDGQQRIVGANVDLGAYEFQGSAYAQHVLYVDSSIAVSGDGSSWSSAMQTLSEAFQKAADCSSVDSILVAKGTYYPNGIQADTARAVSFVITHGLKVYGGYAPGGSSRDIVAYPTILSGDIAQAGDSLDNSFHVLIIGNVVTQADSVIIDGVTIKDGLANGTGDMVIAGHSIDNGKGGGIDIFGNDSMHILINNVRVLQNAALNGGGIYNSKTITRFKNLIVAGNVSVLRGGGIYCYQSDAQFINLLVKGNKSGNDGAGFYLSQSNPKLLQATISGNLSDEDGSGLYATTSSVPVIKNSIVYGNSAVFMGSPDSVFYSLVQGIPGGVNGNFSGNVNPMFAAPADSLLAPTIVGDYHLLPCSPVINEGNNSFLSPWLNMDLANQNRIEDTIVDLGAYEYQGAPGFPSDTSVQLICHGDSILFRGAYYGNSGYFTDTVVLATGCDSLYVLDLSVLPSTDTLPVLTYDSCNQVTFGGQVFLSDTILIKAFSYAAASCDSTFQEIHIHVYHPDTVSLHDEICFGDTVFVGSQAFAASGQYQVVLSNSSGCDSVIHLNLQVNPVQDTLITAAICSGDSYLFGGQNLSASGTYADTLVGGSISGCDSIVTLTLTVNPVYEDTIMAGICPGGNYAFGDSTYTQAGNYTHIFSTVHGCDSTVTLELNVNSYATGTVMAAICSGDSYLFGGQNLSTSGTYTDTLVGGSISGCDSIVTLMLTVNPVYEDTIAASICPGGNYAFDDSTYTQAGNYTHIFSTVHGCDSTVTLELNVNSYATGIIAAEICSGDSYLFGGQNLSTSGTYTDTLVGGSIFGCDSIVTLTLTVNPVYEDTIAASICPGGSYAFGDSTYTQAGNYTHIFPTVHGCDSIVTLTLTVLPPPVIVEDTLNSCDSIIYNGTTYWSSTLLSDTLSGNLGCDSVYLLTHLIIFHSDTTQISMEICQGDTAFVGNQSFVIPGNYQISLTTPNGCDSLVSLSLTVHPVYETFDTVELCPSALPFSFGSQSLSSSGTYIEHFATLFGCDSIVHLLFTVVSDYQAFDTVIVCIEDLPFAFGGQSLSLPGNYTDTFISQSGCDSIVHLMLDVLPGAQSISIDTGGCGQVVFEGNTYNQSVVLQDTLHNALGCDSLYRSIHVVVWNTTPIEKTIDSIGCDVVYFDGRNYYADTTVAMHFYDLHGCDSFILNTRIHVLEGVRDTIHVDLCEGAIYDFDGRQLSHSGTYSASYPYWNGCDSVSVLILTVHALPVVNIETELRPIGYCVGDEIVLEGTGALGYRWWTDFGKDYGKEAQATVVLMQQHNVFFVEGRNEWSCLDTAKITIDAGSCCQLFIPNAFTPNGDGRNDKFGVETNGHPKTIRIEIYNRYGQRIFVGFSVGDRWDGLINGQPAAMGEYYYRISGTCTDNSPILEKGSFTLIR